MKNPVLFIANYVATVITTIKMTCLMVHGPINDSSIWINRRKRDSYLLPMIIRLRNASLRFISLNRAIFTYLILEDKKWCQKIKYFFCCFIFDINHVMPL